MTGSVLLAAAVPAVIWAISYPLATALFVVAVTTVAAAGVRALRAWLGRRSATNQPAVGSTESADSK